MKISKSLPASRAAVALLLGLASMVLTSTIGCGRSGMDAQWELVPVEGRITAQGQPLADVEVAFYLQGEAPPGYVGGSAKTDSDGRFALLSGGRRGAVPGSYKVTVSRLVSSDGGPLQATIGDGIDLQQMVMQGMIRESLPDRFSNLMNTELQIQVTDGQSVYDLDLP